MSDRPYTDEDRELVRDALVTRLHVEGLPPIPDRLLDAADAALGALAAADRLPPPDAELRVWERCACGHSLHIHPQRGRCVEGMTWREPPTCQCRTYRRAQVRREWIVPWVTVPVPAKEKADRD